jgi:hypothetical protein
MAASGKSRANENRRIRQEALREQLANGGHVQHVIEISDKLANLDNELSSTEIQRLKAAADIKKGLIDKYLPSMKLAEHTGEGGDPIETKWTVEVVDATSTDT